MEKIDLSTNSKNINSLYNKIVRGDGETTYGVFTVDKSGVLDATSEGTGSLDEFVEEFEDSHVQFGLARVSVPGSDVYKNILLGWCPDSAPAKLRLSFAANFADVARVLSGYHIQITARDSDDLDADEMVARVCAAAGARYTAHVAGGSAKKPEPIKPAAASKPFTPTAAPSKPAFKPKPAPKPVSAPKPKATADADDGWNGENEIEERDFEKTPLENVPSAYKPTKVNIAELRSQKSDTISSQAKVTPKAATPPAQEESKPLSARVDAFKSSDDGRLTSLPKPKVNNAVGSRWSAAASADKPTFGSKPAFGAAPSAHNTPAKTKPEGVFQNHGNENGLTPAQVWAQKRGKYKVDAGEDDLANKVADVSLDKEPAEEPAQEPAEAEESEEEPEPVVEEEAEEEEAEEEEEEPVKPAEPQIIKPLSGGFPAPPKRNLPPAEPRESSPSLPPRAVPSLPARQEEEPKEEPKPEAVSKPSSEESVTAVAQYDYEKDEDNEVGFEEGDEIVEIEFVDEEWWSGKNSKTGESGLFPASYVSLKKSEEPAAEESAPAPSAASGKSAIAEYDYEKEEDNEIGFKEGDLIVEIEFVDEEWWSGKHSVTGEVGVFPGNYVSLQ